MRALDLGYEICAAGGHVRIRRHDGKPIRLGWDTLQRLLHEAVGDEACLVEVFPPISDVVNETNMRHFWVVSLEVLMHQGAWLGWAGARDLKGGAA